MTCQDYDIGLGDYVVGTLDEQSRIEIETHLAACERCRAVAADFGTIRRTALALEPELPSAHLWARLSTAIDGERGSTSHSWGLTWQTLAASLVTVSLVASLVWIGNGLTPVNGRTGRRA
jgi:anti-sigma factor RsiW